MTASPMTAQPATEHPPTEPNTGPPARRVGFRTVLARPAFRRLTVAHGLATLGQLVLTLAVGAHVAQSASPVWASVAVALGFAPYALFSPLAGVLADRVSRSSVLGWSAAARAGLAAAVCAAIAVDVSAPVIVALAAVAAVAATPSYPALAAATPGCVADDELEPANALVTCVENASWIAGPGLFGLLLLSGLDMSVIAGTAAVPLLAAAVVALPVRLARPAERPTGNLREELVAGLALVARRPQVRRPMLLAMLDNLVYGYVVAVLVLLAVEPGGNTALGALQTALAVGALLATFAVGPLTRRRSTEVVLVGGLLVSGAGVVALGLLGMDAPAATLVAAVALVGAAGLVAEVAAVTLLQRGTDPGAEGRVFGVYDQLNVGAIAVGSALAGPLGHALGAGPSIVVMGAAVIALALLGAGRVRRVSRRQVPTAADLGWRPCPPTSSSSRLSTSRTDAPSSSSKALPAQRRPSGTPSTQR